MTEQDKFLVVDALMEGMDAQEKIAFAAELAAAETKAAAENTDPPDPLYVWAKNNRHPFLGLQPIRGNEGSVFQLKTKFPKPDANAFFDEDAAQQEKDTFPVMAFSIERQVVDENTLKKDDLEEIERELLGRFEDYTVQPGYSTYEYFKAVSLEIERAGSKIAKETRRGRGNVILFPVKKNDTIEKLHVLVNPADGKFNGRYAVAYRDYIPEDTIYVLYVGANAFDRAAIYAPHFEDGKIVKHSLITNDDSAKYGFKIVVPNENNKTSD